MEKDENGENMVETVKDSVVTSAYRYTKEELMEIKELPISNERPECLSEKYDSDGVWDPEKWHASLYPSSENSCPAEGYKKDYAEDRVPLKRRIADPRERVKDDDLEVVLSPQRRSFGGGCQVAPTALPRRPISPLENKENESLRLGGARRIGSGRIIASRVFERDARVDKERERDREREFKDKRFRRDFGDKRVFSERRRNDSYAEEEPEWFSGGPTSQSETIELIGFDDKILEDDKRRTKRSRKKPESVKEVECNGGLSEEPEVVQESGADQEVPHAEVLSEQTPGEFDFNEFFNLEKTMPGLASLQQQSVDPALVPLSEAQVPASQQKNIFQELLVAPHGPVPAPVPGLVHHRASPPLFPQRQDFFPGMPPATGFPAGPQTLLDQIPDLHRARNTPQMRALPMGLDQANLEALFQQELAVLNRPQYQQGYNKQAQDKAFRNRQTRMNRSPGPHMPGRTSPGNTVTSVLSPSFTPTSVIKKMYESKEKSRDDPGSRPGSKEETVNSHNSQEDGPPSPSSFLEDVDTSGPQTGGVKACSTPVPTQNRHSKDPDRPRPPSTTGHHTPTMLSPGPSSPFPRPQMYPVPLLPHVPLVRPPPQLHPSVMQRMLAQGIQPQQLGPTLLPTGMFPQAVDLSQLQGLPPALLGQPLYPLGPAGHPLMAPRAAGTHMQLAVMQQQLQQQQRPNLPVAPSGGPQSQSHGPHRTNHSQRRGGSPPLGLAKWFGSDVLQQPLPSMPSTKVISVDELEFHQ
ncbi:eukaryotic translation initiation factor 4E transporter isoform X1 [Onychostoma macrolepis]|uniref:eukaryotic translation initiation factor 4E transporter isoform X1 n=1 Tax=Onychostoma macrolepis TaxID=369639 RepID=UPI00272A77A6|nr:eukaryotic translation initiation factor 4E transporter isoform X1 [Onychostoma macrolepis]XP_058634108.1 eukaryotic translation initiation factor 4E transporter isoform X1 [Onychostoma macrolepis]XP_058634109.1 eukaryotic translation initiation factor 4E transporter isoform X1 [Onychostoma macrolepis]